MKREILKQRYSILDLVETCIFTGSFIGVVSMPGKIIVLALHFMYWWILIGVAH